MVSHTRSRIRAGFLGAVCTVALCAGIARLVGADTQPSPWLSTTSPTLQKEFDVAPGASLPETVAGVGNEDCQTMSVITRPAKVLQSQQTASGCFVNTAFGIASNGLMRFGGSSVAGTMINEALPSSGFIVIPNSLDFMNYTSAGAEGLYLSFIRSTPGPITVQASTTGEVAYHFIGPLSGSLRDKAGSLLPAQTDSLSFSSDGKWFVVDSPNRAMLRVNEQTLEVLPFAQPFNYNLGISPNAQTAISNDGRYVAVASRDFGVFTIYDLSTCGAVPNTITGAVACQSRDLLPFMRSQLGSFISAFNLRFTSDNILSIFTAYSSGGVTKRTKFSLLAPGQTQDKVTYLGMGDSFSSGEGDNLGGTFYIPGTDETDNLCHLSSRSYPFLLSQDLNITDFHSVACSGATEKSIIGIGTAGAQYPGSDRGNAWAPGSRPQLDFIRTNPPDFLTLTIGGNDVGFADDILECATSHYKVPLPNTCKYAADPTSRANVAKLITDQYPKLKDLYQQLETATNNKTKVYVVGYPQFIQGAGGSCGLNVPLNDDERQFVSRATHYMNQVIKAAATAAGAYYLDIEDALAGRNLCSGAPAASMAVNGVTEGNDKHLPWWSGIGLGAVGVVALQRLGIGNESFHPNSGGHLLISQKILSLTGGDPESFVTCLAQPLVFVCPTGDNKVPLPDLIYFGADAVTYANNYNVANPLPSTPPPVPSSLLVDDTSASRQMHIHVEYLLPGSTATVTGGPDLTTLGQYIVDSRGSFNAAVTIPTSIPTGFTTVHVTGTNIGSEQKDYYENIFVSGPSGDLNGNGVPDSQERCGFVAPSGIDVDGDGIDDACDGEIIHAPVISKVTLSIRTLQVKH
jgi:hypothetical protein